MEKIDGYLIEECYDYYSYHKEDTEENRKWGHVPWHISYRKKIYDNKNSALEAINQMNNGRSYNQKFRIVPIFRGEPEIIDIEIKKTH